MTKPSFHSVLNFVVILVIFTAVVVFIFLPFVFVLKEAFVENGKISFHLFCSVYKNNLSLLKNSFCVAIFTTLLTTLASVTASLFFFTAPASVQRIIFFILSLSMISPPFVTALTYINLFGRRGIISYYLLGISASPYGMTGIVLMQSIGGFSIGALLLIGFLQSMDRFEIDTARNLGAKTDNIIVDIIVPKIFPAVKVLMMLTFFRSLSDFGTPAIIGGSCNVMASESYFSLIAYGDLKRSAILNIMILLPALIIFLLYQKSFKNVSSISKGRASSELSLERKGLLYYLISAIGVFFLVWISLLYLSIVFSAFTRMKKGKLIFTLLNFIEAKDFIHGSILRTIVYSLLAALGTTVIGFLIAYYTQIKKSRMMKYANAIAALPYIIPGTFFGLGYLLYFKSPPLMLTGTATIVILNMLFKQLPFSTNIASAAMNDISVDVLNSVRDLGGGRLHELTDAVIPLSAHSIALSFINGFRTTMTTIGSIIFLVYPGQKVLTLVMFDAIQSGNYNVGSVIALLIIVICLAVNFMYRLVLKKRYGHVR